MATYTTVEEEKLHSQSAQTSAAVSQVEAAPAVSQTATTEAPPVASATTADYSDYGAQYNNAMSKLEQLKSGLPSYDPSYDQALQSLFDEIMGYEKFSYNTRDDMLYQNYKQQYASAGRLAMEDTMGQAAALTGGYGSSYGQAVGQQQYGEYMKQMNDVLPELYDMAYQRYQGDYQALQNRYAMTGQLAEDEYRKYQDRLSAYYQELDYWQDTADTAYNRQQYADEQEYQRQQDAYQKQLDAYDRLSEMIIMMGYTPTAEELQAAGMSDGQFRAYLNYYQMQNAPRVSYGGSKKKTTNQKVDVSKLVISNNHGSSWVQVPGMGRLSYAELDQQVKKGTVKATISENGKKVVYSATRTNAKK